MIKFVHLFKNYYLGISFIGIIAFVIQEIPIVISQFVVVPLFYLFFGLWKSNYLLVGTASLFFIIHTINGYLNFIIKK